MRDVNVFFVGLKIRVKYWDFGFQLKIFFFSLDGILLAFSFLILNFCFVSWLLGFKQKENLIILC